MFLLQDALKIAFQMRIEPIDVHKQDRFFQNQGSFFAKLGQFFSIFKKIRGDLLTNCVPDENVVFQMFERSKILLKLMKDTLILKHF